MTSTERHDDRLIVRQVFDAPIELVYRCMTQPDLMQRWLAPGALHVGAVEVDLRVGGRYRVEMCADDGEKNTAVGVYKTIDAPTKLVYTWSWEGTAAPETLVTITLTERDGATEVELIHEGFADAEARQSHRNGWTGTFVKLRDLLAVAHG